MGLVDKLMKNDCKVVDVMNSSMFFKPKYQGMQVSKDLSGITFFVSEYDRINGRSLGIIVTKSVIYSYHGLLELEFTMRAFKEYARHNIKATADKKDGQIYGTMDAGRGRTWTFYMSGHIGKKKYDKYLMDHFKIHRQE